MKVLMHVCCGPDATVALERREPHQEITLFFDNPNIHPEEEYARRLAAFLKVACAYQTEYKIGKYDPESWVVLIQGHETDPEGSARCRICIGQRLERTAQKAADLGHEAIGAVFTTSPHKKPEIVNEVGLQAAKRYNLVFLQADYKKKNGFVRSVQLSKELGIYRQNYCGCRCSLR
jgi:epoxyqueuosine reductase